MVGGFHNFSLRGDWLTCRSFKRLRLTVSRFANRARKVQIAWESQLSQMFGGAQNYGSTDSYTAGHMSQLPSLYPPILKPSALSCSKGPDMAPRMLVPWLPISFSPTSIPESYYAKKKFES